MGFSNNFLAGPYPWLFFGALFFGAALSRATRPVRRKSYPERAKTIKWTFISLYLSLFLIFTLAAVFIPGPDNIKNIRHLYFFLTCAVFFFLALRFKKSLGIVSLFLLLALAVVVSLFLQTLSSFTGETEIARIRVISARDMKLEIIPASGEPLIIRLGGVYFAPVVSVVIFEDYLVFLGARTWYRFEGLTSFKLDTAGEQGRIPQQVTSYSFPKSPGISQRIWSFYERHESRIPGVKSVQIEMDLKRARELSTYSVRIQNDGGVQIIELN